MVCDPGLIESWLIGRSLARDLPPPRADRGGFRVETNSEKELRRWVFPSPCQGLIELGRQIDSPREVLKLCDSAEVLTSALSPHWRIASENFVMTTTGGAVHKPSLPEGYRLDLQAADGVSEARIIALGGALAARGFAAEAAGVFVYDRIETAPEHQRRGLGRAVMSALGSMRRSPASIPVLVATPPGRALYETLGWRVIAPYATAERRAEAASPPEFAVRA